MDSLKTYKYTLFFIKKKYLKYLKNLLFYIHNTIFTLPHIYVAYLVMKYWLYSYWVLMERQYCIYRK